MSGPSDERADRGADERADRGADEPTGSAGKLPPHLSLASGLLMGSADAVPGVSGGTIALIIGIYDRFIEALSTVVKTPVLLRSAGGRRRVVGALGLLVPLGVGILTAYYLVTKFLVGPQDAPGVLLRPETAPICYGFFFGLVLVSLREPWRRIHGPGARHLVAAVLGAAAAAVFVGLPYREAEPEMWMLLFGGAGAIAVMLLPGISGSLLLVILGQYVTIAGAVHDRDIAVLVVFTAGLGLGVLLFVPLLRYLLRGYHDLTMAALTGLMAGSLRALWPFKNNYSPKEGPIENVWEFGEGSTLVWVVVAAVVGGAVVWFLARLEHRISSLDRGTAGRAG